MTTPELRRKIQRDVSGIPAAGTEVSTQVTYNMLTLINKYELALGENAPMSALMIAYDTQDGKLKTSISLQEFQDWMTQNFAEAGSVPVGPIVDIYPAKAAYGTRRLRSGATNCMRVRRANDGLQQDFGFLDGVLDIGALITFSQGAEVTVVTWYDQSGHANDLISNPDPTYQPVIVKAGGILRTTNGKPTLDFGDNTSPKHLGLGFVLDGITNLSWFMVANITDFGNSNVGVVGPNNLNSTSLEILQSAVTPVFQDSFLRINGAYRNAAGEAGRLWTNRTQTLTSIFGNPTDVSAFRNGVPVTMANAGPMTPLPVGINMCLGFYNAPANNMWGDIQEIIIYDTNQLPNRTAIEGSINAYYGIAPPAVLGAPIIGKDVVFNDKSAELVNNAGIWQAPANVAVSGLDTQLAFPAGSKFRVYHAVMNDTHNFWFGITVLQARVPIVSQNASVVCGNWYGETYYGQHGTVINATGVAPGMYIGILYDKGVRKIQNSGDGINWTDVDTLTYTKDEPSYIVMTSNATPIATYLAHPKVDIYTTPYKPFGFSELLFATRNAFLTNVGTVFSSVGGAGQGLDAKFLQATEQGRIWFSWNPGEKLNLGFKQVNTLGDYTTFYVGIAVNPDGAVYINNGGVFTPNGNLGGVPQRVGLKAGPVGVVFSLEVSIDEVTWPAVGSSTVVRPSGPLYVGCWVEDATTFRDPKIQIIL